MLASLPCSLLFADLLSLHLISAGQYQVPGINTANTRFWGGDIEYCNWYHSILDTATWQCGLEVSLHSLKNVRSPNPENSFPREDHVINLLM